MVDRLQHLGHQTPAAFPAGYVHDRLCAREAQAVGLHTYRAGNHDVFAVQLEIVRALGHIAYALQKHAVACPVLQVARREAELAAVGFTLVSHYRAIARIGAHYLGVAEVARRAALGQVFCADHRVARPLGEVYAVGRLGYALLLHRNAVCIFMHAGVHQYQPVAVGQRRTREAALIVERAVGRERHAHPVPPDQIAADPVAPVHRPPDRPVRVELAEHVILAAPMAKAVRVVYPADRRRDVVLGQEFGINLARVQAHKLVGLLYRFKHSVSAPFARRGGAAGVIHVML